MINPNPDIITDKICNLTRLCRANIPTYIYSRTDRSTPGRSADWRKLPVRTLPRTNLSRTFRTPSRTRSPSVPVYFHYLCRTSRTRESEKKERSERERESFVFVCLFTRFGGKSERFKNWGNRQARSLLSDSFIQTRHRIERSTALNSMISLHPSV